MTHSNTREDGFEQLIERALVGSTIEERTAQGIILTAEFADRQMPGDKFIGDCPKISRKTRLLMRAVYGRSLKQASLNASQSGVAAEICANASKEN